MKKFNYEPAPLVLAFVLGPMFETAVRQSLIISSGNPMIFLTKPIAVTFLAFAFFFLISPFLLKFLGKQWSGLKG
jgi:putative tricarboxylic transport membrane protein